MNKTIKVARFEYLHHVGKKTLLDHADQRSFGYGADLCGNDPVYLRNH